MHIHDSYISVTKKELAVVARFASHDEFRWQLQQVYFDGRCLMATSGEVGIMLNPAPTKHAAQCSAFGVPLSAIIRTIAVADDSDVVILCEGKVKVYVDSDLDNLVAEIPFEKPAEFPSLKEIIPKLSEEAGMLPYHVNPAYLALPQMVAEVIGADYVRAQLGETVLDPVRFDIGRHDRPAAAMLVIMPMRAP